MAWTAVTAIGPEVLNLASSEERSAAVAQVARFKNMGYDWWTLKHAFLTFMGGYLLIYEHDEQVIITEDQIAWLKQHGHCTLTYISPQEIDNHAHVDTFTQLLTITQLAWFITTCLGRLAQHLRFSLLELEVLPYIFSATMTTFFWWHKPGDVLTPIPIHRPHLTKPIIDEMLHRTSYTGAPNHLSHWLRHRRRVPTLGVPLHINHSVWHDLSLGVLASCAFGAWQFSAWDYAFPSPTERLLFRVASVVTLVLPFCLLAAQALVWKHFGFFFGGQAFARALFDAPARMSVLKFFAGVYALGRLFIIVEVFISLRSSPAGVHYTVDWASYLPKWG